MGVGCSFFVEFHATIRVAVYADSFYFVLEYIKKLEIIMYAKSPFCMKWEYECWDLFQDSCGINYNSSTSCVLESRWLNIVHPCVLCAVCGSFVFSSNDVHSKQVRLGARSLLQSDVRWISRQIITALSGLVRSYCLRHYLDSSKVRTF